MNSADNFFDKYRLRAAALAGIRDGCDVRLEAQGRSGPGQPTPVLHGLCGVGP